MFVVLESKKLMRRDLSMSKDMRDWLQPDQAGTRRACLGVPD